MTQFLPPNLLALFAPRDPIGYVPPVDKLRCEKESDSYTGVADFLKFFEDPKDTPAPTRGETKDERRERKKKERAEQTAYKLEQDLALWDPSNNDNAKGDPFKTLFIGRINFDTSESKLRREFDEYGTIRRVIMVKDKESNKPRGYAYIEFEHERDMIAAYKKADGKKIDGRRILVDVERGRTVKGWTPRRLGGGLGNTRRGGNDVNTKCSGREDMEGRERMVPDERDRSMREVSRDRRKSRSRDRRRSRSRDRERRKRSRSRERKRSPEREFKREPGEFGSDSARKRARRSRSRERRDKSRSRDKKRNRRSRSKSRGKKERVKTQVKEEMSETGFAGYGSYSGMPPPPNMFVKQEHEGGYYPNQQQNMYNHHAPMPPLPGQPNPYHPPQGGANY